MVTENKILMQQARKSLEGKWGIAIGVSVLYLVISMGISIITGSADLLGFAIQLLLGGPLLVGLFVFFLSLSRKKKSDVDQLFDGFTNFWAAAKVYLLTLMYTLLWALLFIIPGIIAAIRYSQALWIVAEKPNTGARAAIEQSKKMMDGHKWKYFCLGLRFFGWLLLSILTLGIGFLWFMPYLYMSHAKFYDDVKKSRN